MSTTATSSRRPAFPQASTWRCTLSRGCTHVGAPQRFDATCSTTRSRPFDNRSPSDMAFSTSPPVTVARRPWVSSLTHEQQLRNTLLVMLTAASGAVDAISFLGLGQVFTAVMTGNMVFLGLAIGRGAFGSAARSAVSIPGYAFGVALGTRLTAGAPKQLWPRLVTRALRIE